MFAGVEAFKWQRNQCTRWFLLNEYAERTDHTSTSHRPHIDLTSTSHRPHIDPTSTSHRPYIDLTSNPHRPHIDLTSTLHRPHIDLTSILIRKILMFPNTLFSVIYDWTFHLSRCPISTKETALSVTSQVFGIWVIICVRRICYHRNVQHIA